MNSWFGLKMHDAGLRNRLLAKGPWLKKQDVPVSASTVTGGWHKGAKEE